LRVRFLAATRKLTVCVTDYRLDGFIGIDVPAMKDGGRRLQVVNPGSLV
jgi:hypothetical protein